MTTYEVTYSFPNASGYRITSKIKNLTKGEAERICKNIEQLEDYRLVDVTAEI